jgi:hypothetical protein
VTGGASLLSPLLAQCVDAGLDQCDSIHGGQWPSSMQRMPASIATCGGHVSPSTAAIYDTVYPDHSIMIAGHQMSVPLS